MKNINKSGERIASWHITVGYDEIIQAQSFNYKTYHAGCTAGNNTSIGVEICMYNDAEKQKQAYLNAIELVKILLKYYKWDTSKVKRHKDWTGKHCPAWLIDGKYGYKWSWFKQQLKAKEPDDSFLIKVIYSGSEGLNIRQLPNTKSKVMGQVHEGEVFTIIETNNNWGLLKSKLGWICLNSKYVKKL